MKNKAKFYIVGNSGLAKEILFLALEAGWSIENFAGFIDYQPEDLQTFCLGSTFQVLDEDTFLTSTADQAETPIFFGIGTPKVLEKALNKFKGFYFPNLIHPSVSMHHSSITIGEGVYITAGCKLTCDISIDSFNLINLNCTIGHDSQIGKYNIINPGVNISGGVSIGHTNLIGTNATILQGLNIGNNNVIGASSLVTKNIASNLVSVGVPAKPIKQVE